MNFPERKIRGFNDIRRAIQREGEEIVANAQTRLERHFMFKGHINALNLTCQSGTLRVTGKLPSFYLKQVLQTALRDIPGVERIENQVAVADSNGLSNGATAAKNKETFP